MTARSEADGGHEIELIATPGLEPPGVTELDLRVQVVKQREFEVRFDPCVDPQLAGVKATLKRVTGFDEPGPPDPAEVERERLVSAFDPEQRRPILAGGHQIAVARDDVDRIAAQEGELLLVEEDAAQDVLRRVAAQPEELALVADAEPALRDERQRVEARPGRGEILGP